MEIEVKLESVSSTLSLCEKSLLAIEESMAESVIENDLSRARHVRRNIETTFTSDTLVPALNRRDLIRLMGFTKQGLVSRFTLNLFIHWLKDQTEDSLIEMGYSSEVVEYLSDKYM